MKPEPFYRHKKIALQLSGGKDSVAVLFLLKPYLTDLTVYYCDSGDSLPETHAVIEKVKSFIPNFVTVYGKNKQTIEKNGWPSDVVGCANSGIGVMLETNPIRLNDRYSCCYSSIMEPLHQRMKDDGITLLIRGQKNADDKKPSPRSGDIVDGFEAFYPIENWSEEKVFSFLKEVNAPILPLYAQGMKSGADCLHCTAWLEHGLPAYLKANHPKASEVVEKRLQQIAITIFPYFAKIMDVTNG